MHVKSPDFTHLMKHSITLLLTGLLVWASAPLPAQIPISAYVEAGLNTQAYDAPAQVSAGLEFGRHDFGVEFAPGYTLDEVAKIGLHYRFSMQAAAAQGPLDPFVQVGISTVILPSNYPSRPFYFQSDNLDVGLGLKVGLGLGISLRGHAGLQVVVPRGTYPTTSAYGFDVGLRPGGGIGLAYSLGLNHKRFREIPGQPASLGRQHEFGLAFTRNYLQNKISYSDLRFHYAFRLAPRWDFRFALDVPTWPFDPDVTVNRLDWRPGVFLGTRFWAYPGARIEVFAEGGIFLPGRFPLNAVSIGGLRFNFEPELSTGFRTRITPALHAELITSMRLLLFRGIYPGVADNGFRVGLAYRLGGKKTI